ncbi:hypothetical protein [Roseinatronobacter bogoriensis]|uniref:hypothetical protein n=1 Tax=Roseinatronobacter bogoriensis TaxID=119542 RepID=UPI001066DFFB|nr:hypothetical protein [Rhodobaca bogoriensis]MBB4207267.1 hypothetical protein [Rhodobaca bogoriensis DSM 18756]TDY65766.1 hypothetical protein EV660_11734 [Rhodobaca bogoriensis DSM 18756]
MVVAMRQIQAERAVKQQIGVKALLEWAFGAERASVEFDEVGVAPVGVDTIWLLMQRGRLGCKVDGGRYGGGAQSASDAEIVAAIVAALPVAQGGRGMAVRIAELARAGLSPEYFPDASPRVVPLEMRRSKYGLFATTVDARDIQFAGFGRFPVKDSRCCPVRVVPTAQQIGAARRFWLDWVGALMFLQAELRMAGLSHWEVTDELPPIAPWRGGAV